MKEELTGEKKREIKAKAVGEDWFSEWEIAVCEGLEYKPQDENYREIMDAILDGIQKNKTKK